MKTAIYATLFHSISTDQKPQHFKCPTGKDSWCFFQAALARGEVPGPHVKHVKTPLKETHLAKIMPIYQRLASNELLQRCIRCVTQNANESLHSIIWVIYSQFGSAIHQNDHQARRRFVEWAQNEIAVVPDFHKRILFSDEAHFWLNGYVNKQNCRIWSEANPQVYVETPLHPEKLTVWCALWAGGILLQKR
ncbi:uncharacterized protein TNCV_2489551 [Trichonephila clavipes]|nr:uncharacterized protein TNCV_2489551 [Trichonephila clavipes]